MKKPILRTQYSDRDNCGITFPEQGVTKQSFKDECNINNIINRYITTGQVIPTNTTQKKYGIQPPNDRTKNQYIVAELKSEYEKQPPDVREQLTADEWIIQGLTEHQQQNTPEGQPADSDVHAEADTSGDTGSESDSEAKTNIEAEST